MARTSKMTGRMAELVKKLGGTIEDAAKILDIHQVTLYRWARKEREGKPLPKVALMTLAKHLGEPNAQAS